MDPILALISDLYTQITNLQQENAALRATIDAEDKPKPE